MLGDVLWLGDTDELGVRVKLPESDCDADCVLLGDSEFDGVGETEAVAVLLSVCVNDGLPDAVPEDAWDGVADVLALCVADGD